MQWANYKAAAARYRQLVSDLNLESKTILDAGCGMGDLLPYIYAQAHDFTYLGVDVTPEFIAIARKRYDGEEFQVANPFDEDFTQKFDIVISSGVMNSASSNWLEERQHMIMKLFTLANEALVFNMAGGFEPRKNTAKVAYADPHAIVAFCRTLTPKVILKAHYHPKDFTVVLFK